MEMRPLYELLDAKPFRPFELDLVNGRIIRVDHPENVHLIPGREKLRLIVVYYPQPEDYSFVFPEGITAFHVRTNGNGNGRDEPS
jgi:hypothetical protein